MIQREQFDDKQRQVYDEARAWLDDPNAPQVKYLAGYAGTGKTTLARFLVEGRRAHFCAFTGKAAMVLRDKGCHGATTIHQLIYKPEEVWRDGEGGERVRAVEFVKNDFDSLLATGEVDVVVADECSMIDDRTASDLISFGVKILVIGDPFQLPPVRGRGIFSALEPAWTLTEVHRQARESGVLKLATDIRQGGWIDRRPGAYGADVAVLTRHELRQDMEAVFRHVKQVLVGTNSARHHVNEWARKTLGFDNPMPVEFDKLVCLRNNHRLGLANGQQWRVVEDSMRDRLGVVMRIESLDLDPVMKMTVEAHAHHFLGAEGKLKKMPWYQLREREEFDFAYGMTVHKSQGSQWDSVCVIDESEAFGEFRAQHLYTAVTRAAKELILVVPS